MPVDLPARSTRGKRMKAVLDEEEAQADNDFWAQEFFADEERDESYETEAESEDVPDSDFDVSEADEDEDDEEGEPLADEPRRKVLKPPGAAAARGPPKPKAPPRAPLSPGEEAERAAARAAAAAAAAAELQAYEAPSLRQSTLNRVAQAEQQRIVQEQVTFTPPAWELS